MKKELSVVVLLLVIQGLAIQDKTFCVKSNILETNTKFSCNCHNYTDWPTLTSNSSRYLKSYTKICFPLGTFNLSTKLMINNVSNISIIGTDSVKPTSIKCYNNSFLAISNSKFVEIQNLKLENCGANVQRYIKVEDMQAYIALLLQNVRSVAIFNIVFRNSYGHSIMGINLMGSSVIQQVTVFYVSDSSVREVRMGGIILMFTANHSNYGQQQNILIEHCQVYYMNNIQERIRQYRGLKKTLCVLAFGFAFHQQTNSVSIKIINTSVTNVKSLSSYPLVYILYNSNNINSVTILNCNFSNNIVTSSILTINEELCTSCNPVIVFESDNNTFSYNKAQSIYSITKSSPSSHHIRIMQTIFTHNEAKQTFMRLKSESETSPRYATRAYINFLIQQCSFTFNINLMLEFNNARFVTLSHKNLFANNSVNIKQPKALIKCKETELMFEGYNEFSCNTAYSILELSAYAILRERAIINITQNIAVTLKRMKTRTSALINYNDITNKGLCIFQFYSSQQKSWQGRKNQTDRFDIVIKDNKNYSTLIYGTQLNSCYWLKYINAINFGNLTTGEVMRSVLHFSNNTSEQIVRRKICTLCYCDDRISEDCINDHFGPIHPGQNIPINLKQTPPYSNTSIYSIAQPLIKQLHGIEQCTVKPDQLNWLLSINKNCTPISYKIYSKSHKQCYVAFKTSYPDDSLYVYYIEINGMCPLGFNLIDESCECHNELKVAFPSIACDINTQTIMHLGEGWIGLSTQHDILYVKFCAPTLCKMEPSSIQLNSSDIQCNFNRGGVACGQCPSELSAVFGSLRCKRCSNQWLFLILIFLVAGLLLVIMLFALNITVVDGKINGFIFYVNGVIANMHAIFPYSSSIIVTVMSLMNLDLGIETCFYHGMTEYDKMWLQFVFPSYLLSIVAMLAFASRYFGSVERLTRRRVIPVIATIFLLTYSKLLLITTKVLFSYTTVYSVSYNTETTIWMWDSSIPLFGIKFSILFIASLLLMLVVLVPINFFLLFTKLFLRIRLLAKYLKPYLDAFQAPFKDDCRYYPGLELIARWITFAIGSRFLKSPYTRLGLNQSLIVFFLVYLGIFKPFKSRTNNALYICYAINLECLALLVIYSGFQTKKSYYIIMFYTLLFIALAQFVATVLYYLYVNRLQKIQYVNAFASKMKNVLQRFHKFKTTLLPSPSAVPLDYYEQIQEELLLEDPV